MKDRDFTGRCSCLVSFALAMTLGCATPSIAAEAEAAHDVEWIDEEQEWQLDPAIFTELSPITTADVAIKLPEDQEVDE